MLLALLTFVGFVSAGTPVVLPGSEVQLPAMPGFMVETRWVGVGNPTTQAALLISRVDAPVAEMLAAMTPEALSQQGVALTRSRPVHIEGYDGTWMEGLQSGLSVWVVVVGDEHHCWIFKGTAPTAKAGRPIAEMVKGATWGDLAPASLAFAVEAPAGMQHASDTSGASIFTVEGTMGAGVVGKPLFAVAPGIRSVSPTEETARAMLATVAGLEGVTIESTLRIVQAGMSG